MAVPHPNATVGLASGIGGGQIVVNVAEALGYNISTGWGITIAGALSGIVLFIGRHGILGAWNVIKHGGGTTEP
jgi:hypothetical protein